MSHRLQGVLTDAASVWLQEPKRAWAILEFAADREEPSVAARIREARKHFEEYERPPRAGGDRKDAPDYRGIADQAIERLKATSRSTRAMVALALLLAMLRDLAERTKRGQLGAADAELRERLYGIVYPPLQPVHA